MAESALRLLADGDLHRRMSLLARERAEERFGVDPAIDRYEAAYHRVLAGS